MTSSGKWEISLAKPKRKLPVILGVVFVVAVIAALVISSTGNAKYSVEVCKTFDGRSNCFSAAAENKMDAERAATEGACSGLTSGMNNLEQCRNSEGKVTWKQ
jgi:hypothetical protein